MNLVLNGWFFQLQQWSDSSVNDRLSQHLCICLCKPWILDTSDAQAQKNVRSSKQLWRRTNQKTEKRVHSLRSWAKKEFSEWQKRDTYLGQTGAVPLKAVRLRPFTFTVYPMAGEKELHIIERNLSEKLKLRKSAKRSVPVLLLPQQKT